MGDKVAIFDSSLRDGAQAEGISFSVEDKLKILALLDEHGVDYIEAGNPAQVAGRGHYGKDFAAALAEGSRFAVQFHPEKSHTHGLQLLQNFASWDGRWA